MILHTHGSVQFLLSLRFQIVVEGEVQLEGTEIILQGCYSNLFALQEGDSSILVNSPLYIKDTYQEWFNQLMCSCNTTLEVGFQMVGAHYVVSIDCLKGFPY